MTHLYAFLFIFGGGYGASIYFSKWATEYLNFFFKITIFFVMTAIIVFIIELIIPFLFAFACTIISARLWGSLNYSQWWQRRVSYSTIFFSFVAAVPIWYTHNPSLPETMRLKENHQEICIIVCRIAGYMLPAIAPVYIAWVMKWDFLIILSARALTGYLFDMLKNKTLQMSRVSKRVENKAVVIHIINRIMSFMWMVPVLTLASWLEDGLKEENWNEYCLAYLFVYTFYLFISAVAINLLINGELMMPHRWLGLGRGRKGKIHTWHVVDRSPWPISCSLGILFSAAGFVCWVHCSNLFLGKLGLVLVFLVSLLWWRDIWREGTYQGKHSSKVEKGLRLGMLLFITREVCFFASFFWAYFHMALRPSIEISSWPPLGVTPINPYEVPLLNTILLLSRGATMTWAHISLLGSKWVDTLTGLFYTVLLGLIFTWLQAMEYKSCRFTIADSVFGRTFYIATGFHGLHVLVGTLFILIILFRHLDRHFSCRHHRGFEARAWYWHFVDVVWLFLYRSLYCWGYYVQLLI